MPKLHELVNNFNIKTKEGIELAQMFHRALTEIETHEQKRKGENNPEKSGSEENI